MTSNTNNGMNEVHSVCSCYLPGATHKTMNSEFDKSRRHGVVNIKKKNMKLARINRWHGVINITKHQNSEFAKINSSG